MRLGLNRDDKKDAGWDAVAGKHPLENQRNSSRLGSAAPLRAGYPYGSKQGVVHAKCCGAQLGLISK